MTSLSHLITLQRTSVTCEGWPDRLVKEQSPEAGTKKEINTLTWNDIAPATGSKGHGGENHNHVIPQSHVTFDFKISLSSVVS